MMSILKNIKINKSKKSLSLLEERQLNVISKFNFMRVNNDLPVCVEMAHEDDAGIDIRCPREVIINPNEQVTIPLGVAFDIPEGYMGMLALRSSGSKAPFIIPNSVGIIDSNFKKEVSLILRYDHFKRDDLKLPDGIILDSFGRIFIDKGAKICQMVLIQKPLTLSIGESKWEMEGRDGFGSSDKKEDLFFKA